MEAAYNDVKLTAYKKVYGDHSLTVGEIFMFLIGVAVIVAGQRAGVPGKWKLHIGLAIIGLGQALF